jgi:hypothetical protein
MFNNDKRTYSPLVWTNEYFIKYLNVVLNQETSSVAGIGNVFDRFVHVGSIYKDKSTGRLPEPEEGVED